MTEINNVELNQARLSYRALKATRTRTEPLLTSTDQSYVRQATARIVDIDKRMNAIVTKFPGLTEPVTKKRVERDEATGKIEIDREAALARLAVCSDRIVAEVARILTSHASRKALAAAEAEMIAAQPAQQLQLTSDGPLTIEGTAEVVTEVDDTPAEETSVVVAHKPTKSERRAASNQERQAA